MSGGGFNPGGVWAPRGRGFSMGFVQPEGRVIRLTGQVAWDASETIVGAGDPAAQTRQCFENIRRVLAEVGGALSDIVELTTWITDAAYLPAVQAVRVEALGDASPPVSTSVVVAALGHPEFLVELTPVAVVRDARFRAPAAS